MLVVLLMTASVAWAKNDNDLPARKVYRITPGDHLQKHFVIKFDSERSMDRFIERRDLPATVKRSFRRFNMVSMDLSVKEAEALAGDRDIVYIQEEATYRLALRDDRKLLEKAQKGRRITATDGGSSAVSLMPEHYPWGIRKMGVEAFHARGYLGQGVKVGVIDSGIDFEHPDLTVIGGRDYTGADADNYGDVMFHGTHVAGIIAAKRNGFGVIGMAPDAELYSLQIFNLLGMASEGAILSSLQWCIDNGIEIVNMSFGGRYKTASLRDACSKTYEAGVLLIAAAGNEGNSSDSVGYPAKFETVVAVSAIDESETVASWSSRGPAVEVTAPGVDVFSTFTWPLEYPHLYDTLSGTSMACPHVVGLAALIKSANPGITNVELRRRLSAFVKDLGLPGRDKDYGYGLPLPDRPDGTPDSFAPGVSAGGPYRVAFSEPIRFTAEGTVDGDDNFLDFEWDFGDGTRGRGVRSTHAYARPGDYTASLTVSDRGGRIGTATTAVSVRAGVERILRISATDLGYLKEPSLLYLGRTTMTIGLQSRARHVGAAVFTTPVNPDIFILSAELTMTGQLKNTKMTEGVISAGILPAEIAAKWPAMSYNEVTGALLLPLEPPVTLSFLKGQVDQGLENRFAVPYGRMAEFESRFMSGRVACRVDFDTFGKTVSYTYAKPEIIVRYIEGASTGNRPPVAVAGPDRRVHAGAGVVLDGSASFDRDGGALSYLWVQLAGAPVALTGAESAKASFVAPGVSDTLVFELRVNDGIHTAADRVKIFLNGAAAEVHQAILRPGYGKAGFVAEDWPEINFFDKREILVGAVPRTEDVSGETVYHNYGEAVHFGAIQFDLSAIPAGSQISSATLEITASDRISDLATTYQVKVLEPSVDDRWASLTYGDVTAAAVIAPVDRALRSLDLKKGKVNSLKVDPALIEARRLTTDKITFRIDGPTMLARDSQWFRWWSGNETASAQWAPRLVVKYAASRPAADLPAPEGGDGQPADSTPPVVDVVSPKRGEAWMGGQTKTITWTADDDTGVDRVNLFYSIDGGMTWGMIAEGLAGRSAYAWTVPDVTSSNARIMMVVYDEAGNAATYVRSFVIR